MDKVTVQRAELLETLRKNREEHKQIFEEALAGYRTEVVRVLEARLADARQNRRIDLRISLVQPVDQTKEYDRAIRMCEMSVDDTIELSNEAFANYVMDDWSWSHQFLSANSTYSATARGKL